MLAERISQELIQKLGPERYFEDMESLITHSYDATPMLQAMPEAVVYPSSTEDVSQIMKIASKYKIPVYTRGGGSNLAGAAVPLHGGLVMVTTKMNRLLEVDEKNLTATFETGLVTQTLHIEVEKRGLFYPPDPGSMAVSTLGGNIAQCSGGLRGLKYGTTKDYVIGLTAVLPSGEIIKTGGKLTKDVAGYDLTSLLVGSEGTLAVITQATVKLIPKPAFSRVLLAFFEDMRSAAQTVSDIIAARIIPATLEFMDHGTIKAVEDYAHIGLPLDRKAMLLIGQDGPLEIVLEDIDRIAEICRSGSAKEVKVAASDEEANQLMTARRTALAALSRLRPTTILEDATVPRSEIAAMVEEIERISDKYNIQICTFGHAGDGNLHPTCMTDARLPEEIKRVEQAFEEIFEAALRLGGTITGEHGVGVVKAPFLEWKVGSAQLQVMRGIKQAFDPDGILNPGKLFTDEPRTRGGAADATASSK